MENIQEAQQIINDSKNICLIPSEAPEAITATLALFYTLKELGKNVNLIIETIPENLKFLAPSLDFISYPKNFVISIPNRIADISQIYYEKNDDAVKIFLTLESGNVKKDDISFYFSETKPDLVITLGIKDYSEQLKNKLNSFGFLLDSPVLNIDSGTNNKNFGKINLVGQSSLTEIIFNVSRSDGEDKMKKELATCLLSGIVLHTNNFNNNITADIFEVAGGLMKRGADLKEITNNIYKNKI
jgi:nanoRNase/pAp phosphatase (c-di-AMP/oligoRNAs hydrolase)